MLPISCSLPPGPEGWTEFFDGGAGGSMTIRRAESAGEVDLFTNQTAWNLPTASQTSLQDAAELLAGLPSSGAMDPYAPMRQSAAWRAHAKTLDELWRDFEARHEGPIRQWAAVEMPDLAGASTLFYPFSGPDFLFANAFFPRAEVSVLCGLEPAEALPDLSDLSPQEIASGLETLRTAISNVIQFSFFITKDMRNDLQASRFKGVLPILMVFLARTGHSVESVDAIRLDASGTPLITPVTSAGAPGLLIRARSPRGSLKRLFYVRQNLADDELTPNHPFLAFVSRVAPGPVFLKSASYLMHEDSFRVIREHVLRAHPAIVQDPSGVPYRLLEASGHQLRLYGNYQRTLDLFGEHCQQSDLAAAYARGDHAAQPLSFGIGYLYQPATTCLMVARQD
ncbi:MAG: hypothetical protein KDK99_10280 [Verrucomicrobiales bacterium]|nr:hypothetical protein [Verrucomicrobiales bacterium]